MGILMIVFILLAILAGYVYIFGIPPQFKRELENKALETMGENKASYMAKSYVDKIPASDQEDVREVKKGVGNAVGGALQNPLGGLAGDTADEVTKPLTGR
ncbi:hypothetical protein WHR41_05730 [Cladosporium halotolerans]|uniref:Uncharacterized protein n=1 Tax=Cladosporium halotolerans TaxID=1052096 RepID=A0AB34KQC0_9PEZI